MAGIKVWGGKVIDVGKEGGGWFESTWGSRREGGILTVWDSTGIGSKVGPLEGGGNLGGRARLVLRPRD